MTKKLKEVVDAQTGEVTTIEDNSPEPVQTMPAVKPMTISEKAVTLANGKTFVLKRRVTMPLLSWKEIGKPITFKALDKYKYTTEKETKKGEKLAATPMMPVIDLQTGQEARLIVGAIMLSLFEEDYKNEDYVGKSFALINHGKPEGKRFNDIELVEIEEA